MNDENQGDSGTTPEGAPPPPPPPDSGGTGGGGSGGSKTDVVAAVKGMHFLEKLLLVSAVVYLLAFIFDNRWRTLFKFGTRYYQPWMFTFGFIGSLGALALIGTKLFGVKLVDDKLFTKLLILCAVLPALGLVIQLLTGGTFWYVVMLLVTVAMAYAGVKITDRERLLK